MKKNKQLSLRYKIWLIFGNTCAIIWAIISLWLLTLLFSSSFTITDNPNNGIIGDIIWVYNIILDIIWSSSIITIILIWPWIYLWSSFRSWQWYNGSSDKLAKYAFLHPFIPILIVVMTLVSEI